MRAIGFIGISLLAVLTVLGLVASVQSADWRGIALMLFMVGLLAFFAYVLLRGAKLAKRPGAGEALAEGWAGQPVGLFLRQQVAKSIEGRILIAGTVACLVMAAAASFAPSAVGLAGLRANAHATLFGLWPVVAFVGYVKVCGPRYVTSIFSILATVAMVVVPFVMAYK